MAADASIVARIGGDATGLVGALDTAKGAVRQFGDGVGKIADGLARKFEFRDVARTLATALGINLQAIAEKVARFYVGLGKEEEAFLERMVESTGKAADAQEDQLKRVRAAQEKYEKDRAENIQRERTLYLNAIEEGKKLDAEAAAAKAKQMEDAGFAADLEWVKEQDRIAAEKDLKLQQIEEVKRAKIVAAEEAARASIAIEMQMQEDYRNKLAEVATKNTLIIGNKAYGESRSPEEIKRASDKELQELVKRQKAEIQSIESGKGRGPGALADAATNFLLQGTVIARLQTDVMRALSEINLRRGLKGDIAMFGEDVARSRFGGDPLAFDKLVQEFVSDKRDSKEIGAQSNRLLEDIKRRLDGGILTLPTNVIQKGGG